MSSKFYSLLIANLKWRLFKTLITFDLNFNRLFEGNAFGNFLRFDLDLNLLKTTHEQE
jgi:hypothetical protein